MSQNKLNPQKAFIFRIAHINNVPWVLKHGLHCPNSVYKDPNYINIGSSELIAKRAPWPVPISPGGTLSDYVPFYFTPFSMMMYNIHTGYGGVVKRDNKDIVIFVSSLHRLKELQLSFVFTDQHAYSVSAEFYNSIEHLDKIDWKILQERDFKKSDIDPGKPSRYQAETLVYKKLPFDALIGMGCYNQEIKEKLHGMIGSNLNQFKIESTPKWYFK